VSPGRRQHAAAKHLVDRCAAGLGRDGLGSMGGRAGRAAFPCSPTARSPSGPRGGRERGNGGAACASCAARPCEVADRCQGCESGFVFSPVPLRITLVHEMGIFLCLLWLVLVLFILALQACWT